MVHLKTKMLRQIPLFNLNIFRCIMSESCVEPTCKYGRYDKTTGGCPRQGEERISLWNEHDVE